MMDQYKDLLKDLKGIENEIPASQLVAFNNKLESAINLFDIDRIRDLITNQYSKLVASLNH